MTIVNYALRRIEPDLWEQVKARAASEGRSIRFVLITTLRIYAAHGFKAIEALRAEDKPAANMRPTAMRG